MNQKFEITSYIIKQLSLTCPSEKSFKSWVHLFWVNPRIKEKGGLRLTERGFDFLIKAEIQYHEIKLEEHITDIDNKFILWLDQEINCPFYLTSKKIYVFGDRMAIQLVLFSGNLKKYYNSQIRFKEKQLDKIPN